MENYIKMDDLGVPPILGDLHMCASLAFAGEGIWLDRPGVKLSWYTVMSCTKT